MQPYGIARRTMLEQQPCCVHLIVERRVLNRAHAVPLTRRRDARPEQQELHGQKVAARGRLAQRARKRLRDASLLRTFQNFHQLRCRSRAARSPL